MCRAHRRQYRRGRSPGPSTPQALHDCSAVSAALQNLEADADPGTLGPHTVEKVNEEGMRRPEAMEAPSGPEGGRVILRGPLLSHTHPVPRDGGKTRGARQEGHLKSALGSSFTPDSQTHSP